MSRQNPVIHTHLANKKHLTLFDKIIILAAFLYPLSGLPQVVEVFNGHTVGVSLWSWLSFVCFSALFLAYGLIHKIAPMIITNILWLVVDSLVIIGLLVSVDVA
ncbi:MAG: hypothetical protein JWM07_736 [Candidatus Saccharibacteria bacterium]|nr:hypothetical protein [Candidatus Saccharibacteria bacterium]